MVTLIFKKKSRAAVRKAEGLSRHRIHEMNREAANSYCQLLHELMEEHGLLDKPASIDNVDETGLQLK